MAQQRSCDICGFYRQNSDGSSAVKRYGLSLQVPRLGVPRVSRPNSVSYTRKHSYGGLDICDQCWAAKAKPNTRPRKTA